MREMLYISFIIHVQVLILSSLIYNQVWHIFPSPDLITFLSILVYNIYSPLKQPIND